MIFAIGIVLVIVGWLGGVGFGIKTQSGDDGPVSLLCQFIVSGMITTIGIYLICTS